MPLSKNVVALAWAENGMRHISNSKHPIVTLEDMRGLKFCLPPSDVIVLAFKTLGADTGEHAREVLRSSTAVAQAMDGLQQNVIRAVRTSTNEVDRRLFVRHSRRDGQHPILAAASFPKDAAQAARIVSFA